MSADALRPVGIFDSGVGGLTVARAVIDQLPDEDIIYVGDTGNGPYGPLTVPEIRRHALAIGDDLAARGVKALVIACNSASSACLRDARERYAPVPVVEVILPAVRRAAATTAARYGLDFSLVESYGFCGDGPVSVCRARSHGVGSGEGLVLRARACHRPRRCYVPTGQDRTT